MLQANLIKIFSLPFTYEQRDGSRYLGAISEDVLKEYRLLANSCLAEAEKLLVAYRKAQLKEKGQAWNCSVVDFNDLSSLFSRLINLRLKANETHREQVILICRVFFAAHYTNLDIEIKATPSGNVMSIAILDAVNDGLTYKLALIPAMKDVKNNYPFVESVIYTDQAIQNDLITCPIFAFDLAGQLAKQADLHSHLRAKCDDEGKVLWSDLPLSLLKKAQSKTLLESLSQAGPCNKKGETTLAYLDRHCGFFLETPDKKRNFAVIDLYLKYSKNILPIIQGLSPSELGEIIEGKKDCPTQISSENKLSR